MARLMYVFDTETTGVDVFEDRIVQLVITVFHQDGSVASGYEWIIDPGVEVPEAASAVHGFTTEYLREHGVAPLQALTEARAVFAEAFNQDAVIVAFNLNFDLSIMYAEFDRWGLGTEVLDSIREQGTLFDPLVVDRAKDKYRNGKRTLEAMSLHYGLEFNPDEAHEAGYDVKATARLAREMVSRLGSVPSTQEQSLWYASWATNFESYLRKSDPSATVDNQWPLRLKREGKKND